MCKEIHHTNDHHFDIVRKRFDDHFIYHWKEKKERVENKTLLKHIEGLVIPPMWENVMICSNGCGHILAFGYDQKERKQYIYNKKWQEEQNLKKFNSLVDFATMLPTIRRRAYKDIQKRKWNKQKVLGLAVLVLDETHIRIGNDYYRTKNGTYGLTTLRRKHLEVDASEIRFEYKAKSNKFRKVSIENNRLSRLIKKSSELPGYEIFRYRSNGSFHDISSTDVNEYLKDITHNNYSAKDFRTWGGTSMAVEYYKNAKKVAAESKRKKTDATLVKIVAKELGNTPSICREYYIHPKVMNEVEKENDKKLLFKNHRSGKYALSAAEKKALEIIS